MFFITPDQPERPSTSPSGSANSQGESASKRKRLNATKDDENPEVPNQYRRRIAKACDRCRVKKARCSGGKICTRCKQDGVVCVTTSATKKGSHTQHPEYTHLVESQRDRLAQALYTVLHDGNSTDSTKFKALLADMGIDANNFNSYAQSPSYDASADEVQRGSDNPAVQTWDELFNSLDNPQIEALESFCATTPHLNHVLYNPQQTTFDQSYFDFNTEPSTGLNSQPETDYNLMYRNSQDSLGSTADAQYPDLTEISGPGVQPELTVNPALLSGNASLR